MRWIGKEVASRCRYYQEEDSIRGRRGVWVADMPTTLVVSMDIMRTSYSMHTTRVGASTKFSTTLCTSRSMHIRRNILLAIMHNIMHVMHTVCNTIL